MIFNDFYEMQSTFNAGTSIKFHHNLFKSYTPTTVPRNLNISNSIMSKNFQFLKSLEHYESAADNPALFVCYKSYFMSLKYQLFQLVFVQKKIEKWFLFNILTQVLRHWVKYSTQ